MRKQLLLVVACAATTLYGAEALPAGSDQDLLNAVESAHLLLERARPTIESLQVEFPPLSVEQRKAQKTDPAVIEAWLLSNCTRNHDGKIVDINFDDISSWEPLKWELDIVTVNQILQKYGTGSTADVERRLQLFNELRENDGVLLRIATNENLHARRIIATTRIHRRGITSGNPTALRKDIFNTNDPSIDGTYIGTPRDWKAQSASIIARIMKGIAAFTPYAETGFDGFESDKKGLEFLSDLIVYAADQVNNSAMPYDEAGMRVASQAYADKLSRIDFVSLRTIAAGINNIEKGVIENSLNVRNLLVFIYEQNEPLDFDEVEGALIPKPLLLPEGYTISDIIGLPVAMIKDLARENQHNVFLQRLTKFL